MEFLSNVSDNNEAPFVKTKSVVASTDNFMSSVSKVINSLETITPEAETWRIDVKQFLEHYVVKITT